MILWDWLGIENLEVGQGPSWLYIVQLYVEIFNVAILVSWPFLALCDPPAWLVTNAFTLVSS